MAYMKSCNEFWRRIAAGESISLDYMRLVGSSVLAELFWRQFTGPQIFVFNFGGTWQLLKSAPY